METTDLHIRLLERGVQEELKLAVHATALVLAALMGAYNAAAWLLRREPHLAVNAVFYSGIIAWEQRHVAHHWAELRHPDA